MKLTTMVHRLAKGQKSYVRCQEQRVVYYEEELVEQINKMESKIRILETINKELNDRLSKFENEKED